VFNDLYFALWFAKIHSIVFVGHDVINKELFALLKRNFFIMMQTRKTCINDTKYSKF